MDIGRRATELRVDYSTIRNEIQDGDILLFRGKSWLSRLICWITRSPYSHSAILGWWNGHLMVLEAVSTGVVASRMSLVVNKYSGKIELWTTDEKLARFEVIQTAQLLLGKHHSSFHVLRSLKQRLLGRGRPAPSGSEARSEDFVCSEFVRRVWRAGGVDLAKHSPDMPTTPGDIAKSPSVRKVGALVRSRPGKIGLMPSGVGPSTWLDSAWAAPPPRAPQPLPPTKISDNPQGRSATRPSPGPIRHLRSVPSITGRVAEPFGRFDSDRVDPRD